MLRRKTIRKLNKYRDAANRRGVSYAALERALEKFIEDFWENNSKEEKDERKD